MEIAGKAIILHAIDKFRDVDKSIEITVTLPEAAIELWNTIISSKPEYRNIRVIIGGESRFQSVKNALDSINTVSALVAIHDAVRPLVSAEVILESFSIAKAKDSAITVIPLRDSIRKISDGKSKSVQRNQFVLVQNSANFQSQYD